MSESEANEGRPAAEAIFGGRPATEAISGTASYKVGLFGIPTTYETSKVVIIPVPWEVTTSYGGGTANGPECVLKASPQIDLFDLEFADAWKNGFHMLPISSELHQVNDQLRPKALAIREALENGEELTAALKKRKARSTPLARK